MKTAVEALAAENSNFVEMLGVHGFWKQEYANGAMGLRLLLQVLCAFMCLDTAPDMHWHNMAEASEDQQTQRRCKSQHPMFDVTFDAGCPAVACGSPDTRMAV